VRTAIQWSLAADAIELAGRIAEAGFAFGEYLIDFEAVAWAEAACKPARARRLPVAVTLIAIGALETYLRGDLSCGLAQIAEAERLAAEWALPVPLGVLAVKADLLTMRDPPAAAVV
jgi:hypothetical protein